MDIKLQISEKKGYPVDRIILMGKDPKLLKNEQTLVDCSIKDNDWMIAGLSRKLNLKNEIPEFNASQDYSNLLPHSSSSSTLIDNATIKDNSPEYFDALQMLAAIGYEAEDVVKAMKAAYNNPDRAAEYLMTGIPDTEVKIHSKSKGSKKSKEPEAPKKKKNKNDPLLDFDRLSYLINSQAVQRLKSAISENSENLLDCILDIQQNQPEMVDALLENPQALMEAVLEPELFEDTESEDEEEEGDHKNQGGSGDNDDEDSEMGGASDESTINRIVKGMATRRKPVQYDDHQKASTKTSEHPSPLIEATSASINVSRDSKTFVMKALMEMPTAPQLTPATLPRSTLSSRSLDRWSLSSAEGCASAPAAEDHSELAPLESGNKMMQRPALPPRPTVPSPSTEKLMEIVATAPSLDISEENQWKGIAEIRRDQKVALIQEETKPSGGNIKDSIDNWRESLFHKLRGSSVHETDQKMQKALQSIGKAELETTDPVPFKPLSTNKAVELDSAKQQPDLKSEVRTDVKLEQKTVTSQPPTCSISQPTPKSCSLAQPASFKAPAEPQIEYTVKTCKLAPKHFTEPKRKVSDEKVKESGESKTSECFPSDADQKVNFKLVKHPEPEETKNTSSQSTVTADKAKTKTEPATLAKGIASEIVMAKDSQPLSLLPKNGEKAREDKDVTGSDKKSAFLEARRSFEMNRPEVPPRKVIETGRVEGLKVFVPASPDRKQTVSSQPPPTPSRISMLAQKFQPADVPSKAPIEKSFKAKEVLCLQIERPRETEVIQDLPEKQPQIERVPKEAKKNSEDSAKLDEKPEEQEEVANDILEEIPLSRITPITNLEVTAADEFSSDMLNIMSSFGL
ncbi:hypothetical protein HDU97_001518 [Phlyctochytrium planicorne]|nr:hypothetical protein HDU97_001518 [Phlyctochytrium planicorne]